MLTLSTSQVLYGATIDFGAGNELFTLTVGATNSTIAGGAGNDTFMVTSSNLQTASKIDGGAGKDSVSFGGVLSGGSIVGGDDNDTLNFSAGVNNGAGCFWRCRIRPSPVLQSTLAAAEVLRWNRRRQHGL